MAEYKVSSSDMTSVADAIRTKGGTSAGLSFPDGFVDAIDAIQTGGGSATLITKSIAANGTYNASSDNADGYSEVTVNVPGSIITGTFTGTTAEKGSAKSITVPYSGSGYPVSILIYPTAGGYKSDTDIYASTQYKAIVSFCGIKCDVSQTPEYVNNTIENQAYVHATFKNSSSDSTAYAGTVSKNATTYYRYVASGNAAASAVRFYNSGTNLSVYIAPDGGTEYGFLAGTEYTYVIQYSA